MSKFNIVLLKRLTPALNSLFDKIEEELNEIMDSKKHANDPSLVYAEEADRISKSIKMIGAWGEYKVLETYVELLKVLNSGNINDVNKIIQVSKMAKKSTISIRNYIRDLTESKGELLSVRLWPVWSEMGAFLGKREMSINQLFIPYGDFSDVKFNKVDKDDLLKTAEDIRSQFMSDSEIWKNTTDREKAKNSIISMIESINVLKELNHNKNYQQYWTALSARLVVALNDPNFELDNAFDLTNNLNNAIIEIRNFGKDKNIVDTNVMQSLFSIFLTEKSKSLALTNNAVSEVYQRFHIFQFLNEADNIVKNENNNQQDIFIENIPTLKKYLGKIKESWTKHLNNDAVKNDLLVFISDFFSKKELFPNDSQITPLLNGLINTFKHYKANPTTERIDPTSGKEFATLFFMIDLYLDRKGQVSDNFGEMAELQRNRLVLALDKKNEELKNLPLIEWDKESRTKESENALLTTIQELKKDYQEIEDSLNIVLSNSKDELEQISEKEKFEKLKDLVKPLTTASSIMRILKHVAAVNVLQALTKIVSNINEKQNKVITDQEREYLTVGLSSIGLFLEDLEQGAENPESKLVAAVKLLFNKELQLNNKNKFKLKDISELENNKQTIEEITIENNLVEQEEEQEIMEEVNQEEKPSDNIIDPLNIFSNTEESQEEIFEEKKSESKEEDHDIKDDVVSFIDNGLNIQEETLEEETNDTVTLKENDSIIENKEETVTSIPDIEEIPVKVKEETESERQERELTPREISYDPEDENYYVDDYIAEILEDIPENINEAFNTLSNDPNDKEAIVVVRRTFHTLKGSGKQVNMFSMGYTAQLVEFRFNERLAKDVKWNFGLEKLAKEAMNLFTYWATELKEHKKVYFDPAPVLELLVQEEDFNNNSNNQGEEIEKEVENENEILIPEDISEISIPELESQPEIENIQDNNNDVEFIMPAIENEENYSNNEKEYFDNKIKPTETTISSLIDLASDFEEEEEGESKYEEEEELDTNKGLDLYQNLLSFDDEEELDDLSVDVDNLIQKIQEETTEVSLENVITSEMIDAIVELKDISIKVGSPEMKDLSNILEDSLYLLKDEILSREKVELLEAINKHIINFLIKVNEGDVLLTIEENLHNLILLLTEDNNEILSEDYNNKDKEEEIVLVSELENNNDLEDYNIPEHSEEVKKEAELALDKIIESLRNMNQDLESVEFNLKNLRKILSN